MRAHHNHVDVVLFGIGNDGQRGGNVAFDGAHNPPLVARLAGQPVLDAFEQPFHQRLLRCFYDRRRRVGIGVEHFDEEQMHLRAGTPGPVERIPDRLFAAVRKVARNEYFVERKHGFSLRQGL